VGLSLTGPEEVQRWSDELHAQLEIIFEQRQGKFPIVVSVDGLYRSERQAEGRELSAARVRGACVSAAAPARAARRRR
jgi:hypothetical protein